MKNFEYFEKEIIELVEAGVRITGIAIIDGKPCDCSKYSLCSHCEFSNGRAGSYCRAGSESFIKWLYEEHVEKPKISARTKQFFEVIQTGWVAGDKNGDLYLYDHVVKKGDIEWTDGFECNFVNLNTIMFDFLTLDFIKWEDEKPWSVEDILKLEVED